MRVAQGRKAGGERPVLELMACKRAYKHGTGATVALVAADLGAGKMFVVTNKIQQQHARGHIGANWPAI